MIDKKSKTNASSQKQEKLSAQVCFSFGDEMDICLSGFSGNQVKVLLKDPKGKIAFEAEKTVSQEGHIILPDFFNTCLKKNIQWSVPYSLFLVAQEKTYLLTGSVKAKDFFEDCLDWVQVSKSDQSVQGPLLSEEELRRSLSDLSPMDLDSLKKQGKKGLIPYYPVCYLTSKGIWQVEATYQVRLLAHSTLSNVARLSMSSETLTLHLRLKSPLGKLQGVRFVYRSSLAEQRISYPFVLKEEGQKEDVHFYTATLDLKGQKLMSRFWDPCVDLVDRKGNLTTLYLSMSYRERAYLSFLYFGKIRRKKRMLYPLNSNRRLVFQYRTRMKEDGFFFHAKELLAYGAWQVSKPFLRGKKTILIFEKYSITAQDNGFYFFKHCMEQGEEERLNARIYYCIKKTKEHPERMAPLEPYKDHVLIFESFRHLLMMQAADLLVTTDTRQHVYPIHMRGSFLQRCLRNKKTVFLQHGVTAMKKVDFFYGKGGVGSANLFVVTSQAEKDLVRKNFGYQDKEILDLGFSRWDVLEDKSQEKREILIMPTWRSWLENLDTDEFFASEYFRNYMALLNSKKLRNLLEEKDLTACFYLHSKFRRFVSAFKVLCPRIRIVPFGQEPVNELLMGCRLLVTDYSSVCWDALYLHKPVLYFQFDRPMYLNIHGSYLDMEKELPGECAFTVGDLVNLISQYAQEDFALKDCYATQRMAQFTHRDHENSKRLCDAILEYWSAPGKTQEGACQ